MRIKSFLSKNILVLTIAIFSCKSSANKTTMKSSVDITLEIEDIDKTINVCDNISISYIDKNNITYYSEIIGCKASMPIFPEYAKEVTVILKYDKYVMRFEKVNVDWLYVENMKWNFIIDYPPFDEIYNESIEEKNLKEIHYFRFNPLDGQALEIVKPIYDR